MFTGVSTTTPVLPAVWCGTQTPTITVVPTVAGVVTPAPVSAPTGHLPVYAGRTPAYPVSHPSPNVPMAQCIPSDLPTKVHPQVSAFGPQVLPGAGFHRGKAPPVDDFTGEDPDRC